MIKAVRGVPGTACRLPLLRCGLCLLRPVSKPCRSSSSASNRFAWQQYGRFPLSVHCLSETAVPQNHDTIKTAWQGMKQSKTISPPIMAIPIGPIVFASVAFRLSQTFSDTRLVGGWERCCAAAAGAVGAGGAVAVVRASLLLTRGQFGRRRMPVNVPADLIGPFLQCQRLVTNLRQRLWAKLPEFSQL